MKLTIAEFVFIIVTFICWSTLSRANVYFAIENYMDDQSLQSLCNDDVSLNFSNAVISEINQNFISSPVITCLNLMNNNIEKIGRGAFERLPNLTQLFLSNNRLRRSSLLNFGGHDKLQLLIMNDANSCSYLSSIEIFGDYPNLEILSLRKNCAYDLEFAHPFSESHFAYTTSMTSQSWMPFPKLKILDLSENGIAKTNFVQLLSNSLYFLDLHDNSLSNLNLNEKGNKLLALNLDKNKFNIIRRYNQYDSQTSLSLADLKNLHYLSISRNEINTIESDAFQDNNELLFLNLSSNHINYLHPKTFANLQYLKTLDLSINQLKNIPQISNETEISTLYINNNNIKKIMSYIFVHMPKLMKLLIGENQIDEIDINAFAHLTVLEELDLSRNVLSTLPQGWAEALVSLKYLDLSDNKFTSLESLSLTNTWPSIDVLYLMKNPLECLNVKYFENLPQNLVIDLINNSNFTKWTRDGRYN